MHFHFMSKSQHKNYCPGCQEIYNFGRTFLGHHYFIFLVYAWGQLNDFYRNNAFSLYGFYDHTPAQEPLPWWS